MMLQNYFKVACRAILRQKTYSLINVSGLAVGFAAFFLILQYIHYEMSFDQFHENESSLYRIVTHDKKDKSEQVAGSFAGMTPFIKNNFPEVKHIVQFFKWPANTGVILQSDHKVFNERNYFFTGKEFFQVFSSLLIQGDESSCLTNPNSIVLSERMATKIFGSTDILGKELVNLNRKDPLVVTGIMRDIPRNSSFDVDIVMPMEGEWVPEEEFLWKYPNWWTYVSIDKAKNSELLEANLNVSLQKQHRDNPEVLKTISVLQPISDVHFESPLKRDIKPSGHKMLVYALGLVALIILVLAWINYINLEISRFISRIKEAGIRRIVGSAKIDLILQFFIQYACVNVLAFLVAIPLVYFSLPYYEYVTGISINSDSFISPRLLTIALSFFIVGIILSGLYPAILLSGFSPIQSLKGKLGNVSRPFLRKSLLSFQFICSVTLMTFLFVIFKQLDFMRSKEKNMSLNQILTVYNPTNYTSLENATRKESNEVFRNKLLQHSGIDKLSTSSVIPGEPIGFTYVDLAKRSLTEPDRQVPYKVVYIDYDYFSIFGIKFKAGSNYTPDHAILSLVVSESTAKELGFASAEEAIGKEIYFMEEEWEKWRIIGVVEDYRHESVKSPVYPVIFRSHRNKGQMVYYSIRLSEGSNVSEAIAFAENTWKEVWPEKPFNYFFMDQYYDQQFKTEIHFGRTFGLFATVAIFLACLGILGMTLFEASSRIKEISIRKVLGASTVSILSLLSRSHLQVICVAALISTPLVYYLSEEWLSSYPVRMNWSVAIIFVPVTIVLVLVLFTSGFQLWKTSQTNPADNLKYE